MHTPHTTLSAWHTADRWQQTLWLPSCLLTASAAAEGHGAIRHCSAASLAPVDHLLVRPFQSLRWFQEYRVDLRILHCLYCNIPKTTCKDNCHTVSPALSEARNYTK